MGPRKANAMTASSVSSHRGGPACEQVFSKEGLKISAARETTLGASRPLAGLSDCALWSTRAPTRSNLG